MKEVLTFDFYEDFIKTDRYNFDDYEFLVEDAYYGDGTVYLGTAEKVDEKYIMRMWNMIRERIESLKDKDFWELYEEDEDFKFLFDRWLNIIGEIPESMAHFVGAVEWFKKEFNNIEVDNKCVLDVKLVDNDSIDFRDWKIEVGVDMDCVRRYAERWGISDDEALDDVFEAVSDGVYDVIRFVGLNVFEVEKMMEIMDMEVYDRVFNEQIDYYVDEMIEEFKEYFE